MTKKATELLQLTQEEETIENLQNISRLSAEINAEATQKIAK